MLHEILVLHPRRRFAAPAAPLRLIHGERLCLGVALVGHGDHHVLLGDEILGTQVLVGGLDFRTPVVTVALPDVLEFVPDHLRQALG